MDPLGKIVVYALGLGALASLPRLASAEPTCLDSNCHAEQRRGKFVHGPVGSGSCDPCHRSTKSTVRSGGHEPGTMQTPSNLRRTCLSCHTAMEKQLRLRYKHRPVDKLSCLVCHVPHRSRDRYLLRRIKPRLPRGGFCRYCHKQVRHAVSPKGACTSCHLVHGSSRPDLLHAPAGRRSGRRQ